METKKTNKILIALDYNVTSLKVAETGFLIARSMDAETVLLHVISEPKYYYSDEYSPIMDFPEYMKMKPLQTESNYEINSTSQLFLEKVKHSLGDKTIQTLVKEGDTSDLIVHTANELQADIIIMGSHSRKWLENILMGSVTEKVLNTSTIPLFIIPTKKQFYEN